MTLGQGLFGKVCRSEGLIANGGSLAGALQRKNFVRDQKIVCSIENKMRYPGGRNRAVLGHAFWKIWILPF